jgi:hypothetical protein
MLAAAVPCAASVALYAAGILPTALNMGLVGVAMGACHVVVRVLVLRPSAPGMAAIAPTPAATVIASAVIGLMY